jgi:exodeoxyribonuclease VII large subunit
MARRLDELACRARRAVRGQVRSEQHRVATVGGKIESLSPLAVLSRGYSVTLRAADGIVIRNATDLRAGEEMITRFATGSARSTVCDIDRSV